MTLDLTQEAVNRARRVAIAERAIRYLRQVGAGVESSVLAHQIGITHHSVHQDLGDVPGITSYMDRADGATRPARYWTLDHTPVRQRRANGQTVEAPAWAWVDSDILECPL